MSDKKEEGTWADDEGEEVGRGRRGRARSRRGRGRPRAIRTRRRPGAGSPSTRLKLKEETRREHSKVLRLEKQSYDRLTTIKEERNCDTMGATIRFLIERYEIHQALSPIPQRPRQFTSTPVGLPVPRPMRETQEMTPSLLPPRQLFVGPPSPRDSPIKAQIPATVSVPPPMDIEEEQGLHSSPSRKPESQPEPMEQASVASTGDAWEIVLPPQDFFEETLADSEYSTEEEDSDDYSSDSMMDSSSSFLDVSTYEPSPPNTSDSEADLHVMQEYLRHVGFRMKQDLEHMEPGSDLEAEMHLLQPGAPSSDSESEMSTATDEIITIKSTEEAMHDTSSLSYVSCLQRLANMRVPEKCTSCLSAVKMEVKQVGSALYLRWICEGDQSHLVKRWCSQPRFKHGQHLGDFQLCAGTLFTGNNFSKVAILCEAANMKAPNINTYTRIHRNYAVPAVEQKWQKISDNVIDRVSQEDDVVVLGDGRMDSPGFNAQFCTYTFLENESKDIVAMEVVDKREVQGISVNMEKCAFIKGLEGLQDKGVSVTEVVTDAHSQITALLKRQYPNITHSLDVWHGAKNLSKKLIAAAGESECGVILQWVQDISNHFWYCVKEAEDYVQFVAKWRGMLHHVCGKHEWMPTEGYDDGRCGHDELQREEIDKKEPFESGSKAHIKLRTIILDATFLGRIEKYLNFRTTSELESFNNKILGFASKRFSFQFTGYRARCFLAGLDYQENKGNAPLMTKEGQPRLHRVFRKRSSRWDAVVVKARTFGYVRDLMELAVTDRLENPGKLRKSLELQEGDPRRLAAHSAKVPPPPTHAIFAAKQSRMQKD